MLLNQDPVTLYGPGGKVKSIPAVDAAGWLAAGWSLEESRGDEGDEGDKEEFSPPSPQSPVPSPQTPSRQRKKPLAAQDDADGNTLPEN